MIDIHVALVPERVTDVDLRYLLQVAAALEKQLAATSSPSGRWRPR